MRPTSLARPERGFTLLEVLAAFVVFALTMASLMQVFGGGLRDAQLADEYARAVLIAQSRLDGYTAAERLEEVNASGTESGFAWTLSAIVLILFYGFVIAVAYMPSTLGQPISAGSVLTIGVALEFFLFVFFWGLSAYYVQRANSRYDALTQEVIREALKETK